MHVLAEGVVQTLQAADQLLFAQVVAGSNVTQLAHKRLVVFQAGKSCLRPSRLHPAAHQLQRPPDVAFVQQPKQLVVGLSQLLLRLGELDLQGRRLPDLNHQLIVLALQQLVLALQLLLFAVQSCPQRRFQIRRMATSCSWLWKCRVHSTRTCRARGEADRQTYETCCSWFCIANGRHPWGETRHSATKAWLAQGSTVLLRGSRSTAHQHESGQRPRELSLLWQ
eukprot:jgi/Chrzof1/3725/Cz13g06190.t1